MLFKLIFNSGKTFCEEEHYSLESSIVQGMKYIKLFQVSDARIINEYGLEIVSNEKLESYLPNYDEIVESFNY